MADVAEGLALWRSADQIRTVATTRNWAAKAATPVAVNSMIRT